MQTSTEAARVGRTGARITARTKTADVSLLNEQTKGNFPNKIRGLHITLLKPHSGMEVGAEIEVAVATTYAWG